jgi:hypothetical protein
LVDIFRELFFGVSIGQATFLGIMSMVLQGVVAMPSEDMSRFSDPVIPCPDEQGTVALKRRKEPTVPMPEYRDGKRRRKEPTAPMPMLESVEDL